MRETMHKVIQRFESMRAAWFKGPDASVHYEQVWYAGLAVSPIEFSRQLTNLQLSLQGSTSDRTTGTLTKSQSEPLPRGR